MYYSYKLESYGRIFFSILIILGRDSGMETSEEVFMAAKVDYLLGIEALRGIRCSSCAHKQFHLFLLK